MNRVYIPYRLACFALLLIWLAPDLWGQKTEYEYDAAGNRILRKVIHLRGDDTAEGGRTKSAVTEYDVPGEAMAVSYEDWLGERKVLIFPNPTQGMMRIEFQEYGDLKDVRLLLYDIQGRLLRQINNVEHSNTLDLSQYPAGMYILQMMEGNGKNEWKIVKE